MDKKFLVPFHDFSKDNFPIIKDGVYVINVNDKQSKESKETYQISLFIGRYAPAYFDYFVIEYIPQELLSKNKERLRIVALFNKLQFYKNGCQNY